MLQYGHMSPCVYCCAIQSGSIRSKAAERVQRTRHPVPSLSSPQEASQGPCRHVCLNPWPRSQSRICRNRASSPCGQSLHGASWVCCDILGTTSNSRPQFSSGYAWCWSQRWSSPQASCSVAPRACARRAQTAAATHRPRGGGPPIASLPECSRHCSTKMEVWWRPGRCSSESRGLCLHGERGGRTRLCLDREALVSSRWPVATLCGLCWHSGGCSTAC